jgi:hypothetical protein
MDPEIWVGIAAVFVSGGAIGTAGTLLSLWLLRGIRNHSGGPELKAADEVAHLRRDLGALLRKVRNMDERLDFQEQLLGGANPLEGPPPRLSEPAEGMGDPGSHGSLPPNGDDVPTLAPPPRSGEDAEA